MTRNNARRAYSPYSGWRVGATAVFRRPHENEYVTFAGVNVENASFGLTICAERVAICAGVAAGFTRLHAIAISTLNSDNKPVSCFKPCGACLQVIAEFGGPETTIILDNNREYTLQELLPHGFNL